MDSLESDDFILDSGYPAAVYGLDDRLLRCIVSPGSEIHNNLFSTPEGHPLIKGKEIIKDASGSISTYIYQNQIEIPEKFKEIEQYLPKYKTTFYPKITGAIYFLKIKNNELQQITETEMKAVEEYIEHRGIIVEFEINGSFKEEDNVTKNARGDGYSFLEGSVLLKDISLNLESCVCGKKDPKYRCPTCKTNYCSKICQKTDWVNHKRICQ
jgi:hypothetical protein